MSHYYAEPDRYTAMKYNRCGRSGLILPAVSLGLWNNFGDNMPIENSRAMLRTAFDAGICHFDLANNYGPPPGGAEENFGKIFKQDFKMYRDELILSTKAGWNMWPGPYGDNGSKKYLIASLDQSLARMGIDYVDIFYSHRPDPETPIEETCEALAQMVKSGKALYVGISQYNPDQTRRAVDTLRGMGVKLLIHQPRYSMFDRWIEEELQDVFETEGIGSIAFCPLDQGLLTSRYLEGIPGDSRAVKIPSFASRVTEEKIKKVKKLNAIAENRGQSMAQMALAWVLRCGKVTSVLIGASRPTQIEENVCCINNLNFTPEELEKIEAILAGKL